MPDQRPDGSSKSNGRPYWVGFDLGGTKMLATVFDDDFQRLGRMRTKTLGAEGAKAGVQRIVDSIRDALADAQVEADQLGGIGVGCPGPLDLKRGILLDTPNLGWKNVKLAKALNEEFGCPAVIANDVDTGVYGEYRFGAGKSARCVIGVFPGTGIGGGCVYEGRIVRAATTSCMEIGHVQIAPHGPLCGCGQRGCLEAVASRLAISAAAAQAAFRGEAPNLLKRSGTDLANIRSGALAGAIAAGDKVVEDIVREAARNIGLVVASVVNLLAPDVVVLGGGLTEAMPELIVETVAAAARSRVMPSFVDAFKVVPAQLQDDATIMGAAAWAREVITAGDTG